MSETYGLSHIGVTLPNGDRAIYKTDHIQAVHVYHGSLPNAHATLWLATGGNPVITQDVVEGVDWILARLLELHYR